IQLRIVSPPGLSAAVRRVLESQAGVTNVAFLEKAVVRPEGDLLLCDVAAEATSHVLKELQHFDLEEHGSISMTRIDYMLSRAAREAEDEAPGSSANAVVWEAVEALTSESTQVSASFLAFMAVASLIAAAGLLTDSLILIIGAMIVGPDFGPIAGACVALEERRWQLARQSMVAIVVGFGFAVVTSFVAALVWRATDLAPDELLASEGTATLFVSEPSRWSIIVALAAAVAGMLSLTSEKSGALVGVLVSVTTIPAAANMGLAVAYTNADEFWGSAAQLGLNVVSMIAAGTLTLIVLRRASRRNWARFRRVSARLTGRRLSGREREPSR
ncbi:MAG: DUF389 domain-containing protein, partial [Tepidiformaceae bacterium]